MIVFLSFRFPGVSESLGTFLKLKEAIPNATKLIPTPLWCQRAECYIIFSFFFPLAFAHIALSLLWPSWGSLSGSVWQHLCWPWYVFMGCLCYRRPFLHVSGEGLKALSAAGIPGFYHFGCKAVFLGNKTTYERKLYHLQRSCICCLHSHVFILSSETNPKLLNWISVWVLQWVT